VEDDFSEFDTYALPSKEDPELCWDVVFEVSTELEIRKLQKRINFKDNRRVAA